MNIFGKSIQLFFVLSILTVNCFAKSSDIRFFRLDDSYNTSRLELQIKDIIKKYDLNDYVYFKQIILFEKGFPSADPNNMILKIPAYSDVGNFVDNHKTLTNEFIRMQLSQVISNKFELHQKLISKVEKINSKEK